MNLRLPFVAAASLSLTLVAGCGTDFGDDPDYASIDQRFAAPNGTLTEKNAATLFDRYSSNAKSAGELDVSGASKLGGASAPQSSGLGPRALKVLDLGSEGASSSKGFICNDIMSGDMSGSCDCPNGGSFDYDFEDFEDVRSSSDPIDVSLKTRFNACTMGATSIDGRQFVRLQTSRGLTSGAGSLGLSMMMIADFRVTHGGKTHAVDLVARYVDGKMEMALSVDDGFITVKSSGDGKFVVRDRNGTWTCDVIGGKGECKNDSGETRSF
ncbi:MAG: hypothetical protein KF819_02145 [Labilithrix sp.]|nr:hypothetical protein [Labilithrix sp.]